MKPLFLDFAQVQRRERWRLRLPSRTSLTVVALFASALLLLDPPTECLASSTSKSACNTSENHTTCSCDKTDKNDLPLTAAFSQSLTEFEMQCKDGLKFAPQGSDGSAVCAATVSDITKCDEQQEASNCLDVKQLLDEAPETVKWTSVGSGGDSETKVLSVPPANFPFVDGMFSVGCLYNQQEKCRVNVTVKARATATQDRKVICAYGTDSNQEHQTMTLSPSENSFMLVCGEKGKIVQKDYRETYCPVTAGKGAVPKCAEKYSTILPAYEKGWWTGDESKTFTLTIPKDAFPENDATLMVQCQKKNDAAETMSGEPEPPKPTICSVDVTIKGVGSSSGFSPHRRLHAAGFLGMGMAGAVALLALVQ